MPGFMDLDDDDNGKDLQNELKEENYYKYHENVSHYDPRGQPYSYFYITVMGQIEFGEFLNLDGLQSQFHFVAGADWNIADGLKNGTS